MPAPASPLPPPKKQPIPLSYYLGSPTVWLMVANTVIFLVTAALAKQFTNLDVEPLVRFGANYGPRTLGGEPWRLLTSVFLHGGIMHLVLNMWALLILGVLAEILFGRRSFVAMYLACGISASMVSVWWHFHSGNPGIVAVGASGAIFGLAGALIPALLLQKNERIRQALKGNLVGIGVFVLYNIAYGFKEAHIDNSAHLGGLAAGLVLGFALPSSPGMNAPKYQTRRVAVFVLAVVAMVGGFFWLQKQEIGVLEYARAQRALQQKDYPAAIEHLQQSLARDPKIVDSRYMLGVIYLEQGKNEAARDQFLEAVKIAPDWANAHSELCIAYLRLHQPSAALAPCKRSVELDAKDPDKVFNLGLVQRATEDVNGAIVSFAAAEKLRPGGFDEESLLGETLAEAGRTDEAIQHLQSALKARPSDGRTRLLLARLLIDAGRRDEARQLLQK